MYINSSDVREEIKRDTAREGIPTGKTKWDILDYRIMESIVETQKLTFWLWGGLKAVDAIVAVNNMLRRIIENLSIIMM